MRIYYPVIVPVAAIAVLAPTIMLMPTPIDQAARPPRSVTPLPDLAVSQLERGAVEAVLGSSDTESNEAVIGVTTSEALEPARPEPPRVTGLIAAGGGRGIVLAKAADGETVQLARGQAVDGWRLVSIGRSTAIFDRSGERAEVRLDLTNRSTGSPGSNSPAIADTPPMER